MTFTEYKSGSYTAVPDSEVPGLPSSCGPVNRKWLILDEHGVKVGSMFEGHAYPMGTVQCSMRDLVWSGTIPDGSALPKSPNHGMCFDTLEKGHQTALDRFAARADRLRAWRTGETP